MKNFILLFILAVLVVPQNAFAQPAERILDNNVPFTSQAPFGNWKDIRQQDGCEEASALMAISWARGKTFTKKEALASILNQAKRQEKKFGSSLNTSARDTLTRIIQGYFHFTSARLSTVNSATDIIKELRSGTLIIAPVHGQLLKNPYFTPPGPVEHMLVIKGYDFETREFITNDPGTRRGKNFRYPEKILFKALRDYQTSNKKSGSFDPNKKMIIVISREKK